MSRPLAFIDVDGVLNRLGALPGPDNNYFSTQAAPPGSYRQFPLVLDKGDADLLHSLEPDFELAWGTTWGNANETIGALIGLNALTLFSDIGYGDQGKSPGLVRVADGRPFVWFEDYESETELEWAASRYGYDQPMKIIRVDAWDGLQQAHIDEARAWLDVL